MIHPAAYFGAALDPMITFVIIIVASGVISFLKKHGMIKGMEEQKRDEPEERTTTQAPRRPLASPTQAPRPVATSWEGELRRLLQENQPAAPPPVRPRPVVVSPPTANTPPVMRPVMKPVILTPAPTVTRRPIPSWTPAPMETPVELSARSLAPMQESKRAYENASQIDKTVAEHMNRVPGQRVVATTVTRQPVSLEVTQVAAMFRNASSARQAVIASIILNPPKALEPESAIF